MLNVGLGVIFGVALLVLVRVAVFVLRGGLRSGEVQWRETRDPVPAPLYDRDDDDDDSASAAKVSLPVLNAKSKACGDCGHWDQAAGQRAMQKNPAFARMMAFRAPYEQNWVRDKNYAAKEREISDASAQLRALEHERSVARANAAPDVREGIVAGLDLSISDVERKISELEAELKTLPQWEKGGLDDPQVRAMISLTWDDFGVCSRHTELRAKTDNCEHFEAR